MEDINKTIQIGVVKEEPRIKFIPKLDAHLIEFNLTVRIKDQAIHDASSREVDFPIIVRNPRLALYLKDTLQAGARLYLEGQLIPTPLPLKKGQPAFRIEAREVVLIDKPQRHPYPDGIKKIR